MAGAAPRRDRDVTMLDRICVAYDDGAPSEAALSVAVSLARRAGAALTLVHVADPQVEQPVSGEDRVGFDLLGFTDERRWQARLAGVAAQAGDRLAPAGGGEVEVLTVAGEAGRELPALASGTGAQLIVAGAPRTGLRAALHRSISRRLTRSATRPVLLATCDDLRADGAVLVCVRGSRWADRRAAATGRRLAAAVGAPVVCRPVPAQADAAGYFLDRCEREAPLVVVIAEEADPAWRSRRHHPERVLPRRAACPVVVVGRLAEGPLVADAQVAGADVADGRPAAGPSWEA